MTHSPAFRFTSAITVTALSVIALAACSEKPAAPVDKGEVTAISGDMNTDLASLDTSKAGPKLGDAIPVDMVLRDSDGNDINIGTLSGEQGTVLVFSRSVAWCPYCQAQIKGLKDVADEINSRGYALNTITYDDPETLKTFATNQKIGFPMLSDTDSKLIDAVQLRDPQYTEGMAVGVPYASIFIIDAQGVVQARAVSGDYKVRPTNQDILSMIDAIG